MTAAARPHAVVVGATGMLREATLGLVTRGYQVTAVARGRRRLAKLAAESQGHVHALPLDYRDVDPFAVGIEEAIEASGPAALVIAWIHSSAPDAPLYLAEIVAGRQRVRFLHVLGSVAAEPSAPDEDRPAAFEALPGIRYEEVVLGFVAEGPKTRWLTNSEISAGVLGAVDHPHMRTVVGVVRPWSQRP